MAARGSGSILLPALLALCSVGFIQASFGGVFEPRELEVAREQFSRGNPLAVPTFASMPFLEKPPLYYDLVAGAFALAGGPSLLAARVLVALVSVLWLAAIVSCVRRAAGPRAAFMAAALAALTPLFLTQARRISLDGLLAVELTLALAAAAASVRPSRGALAGGPWYLFLAACGAAFLTKGVFGLFLGLTPLLAFAAWTRDWRIVRALLRLRSLALLAAPVLLWAGILYFEGGTTYLAEAFVNNSLGRFLHMRFRIAGIEKLPYGDVNSPQSPWYYLINLPGLAGLALFVLPFAVLSLVRRGVRGRGPRTRTAALALCWAVVPPLLLSFSSQKGVQHLGACASGFAVLGALWIRPLLRNTPTLLPRWAGAWLTGLAVGAPTALVAAQLGWTGRLAWAVAAGILVLVAATAGAWVLWRWDLRDAAVHGLLAAAACAAILGYAAVEPGPDKPDVPALARLLHGEVGDRPVAMLGWGDSDLGAFSFAFNRIVTPLRDAPSAERYLSTSEPAFCIVRGEAWMHLVTEGIGDRGTTVFFHARSEGHEYTVLANRAARTALPSSRRPPPSELPR